LNPVSAIDVGRDFTALGLFLHADPVVKAIMLLLIVASIACWALIIEKAIRLHRLGNQISSLEELAGSSAAEATAATDGLVGAVRQAATTEAAEGRGEETRAELRGRLERAMRLAMKTELRRIETGLPFLATVGSAAPFVGLFGTVWGIMHSFTSIAQAKDTSLAVVAPGIAEALFATAIGLAAAIPAVVAYNQISVALGRAGDRIGVAIGDLAKRAARVAPAKAWG
jgi:biopolymer transport protein ExbB/TolQ